MAIPNYTPKHPADIVFDSDQSRNLVMDLITGQRAFPAYGCNGIVLYGTYGTGKSTLAAMLPDAIEQARGGRYANARIEKISAENGGADLVTSLKCEAETIPFGQYRYFVLDEADLLSNPAKRSMKNLMDIAGTVWVFCTNDLSGIDGGVKDRSHLIAFNAAPAHRWLPLARRIVTDLGVPDLTDATLENLIAVQSGSARKIVNTVIELAQTVRVDRGLHRL
jgi:replication-associated recombination protein RarA